MGANAAKPKRPASYDLNAAGRRRDLLVRIGLTAIVMLFAVVLVGYIVISHNKKTSSSAERAVRVTSSKLITQDGKPKADVVFYEDFLCPACGNFERAFGPTVSKLIDSGAIAADYYMMGLLSRPQNDDYSSRAGNAAYCVADASIDAFRRFHNELYSESIQPSETGTTFPDNAKLIEFARVAGVVGKVAGLHQGRQVHRNGRRPALGRRHPCHPNGPHQRPGLPMVDAGRAGGQDQRDRRGCPGLDTAATPPAS